jgi:outer membrane phospholipase A
MRFAIFVAVIAPVCALVAAENGETSQGWKSLIGLENGRGQPLPAWQLQDALYPYEPMWLLFDIGHSLNAKFQFSAALRILGHAEPEQDANSRPLGLYFSYSQTSFLDLHSHSRPFYDTSYRPEGWVHLPGLGRGAVAGVAHADLELGLAHESNGDDGPASRSMNKWMARPILCLDLPTGLDLRLRPRFLSYAGDLSDNPDIGRYRGNVDWEADIGWSRGLRLGVLARRGHEAGRGSLQADLSVPLSDVTHGWLNVFLWAQVFSGYGEMLRDYDRRTTRVMVGIGLSR